MILLPIYHVITAIRERRAAVEADVWARDFLADCERRRLANVAEEERAQAAARQRVRDGFRIVAAPPTTAEVFHLPPDRTARVHRRIRRDIRETIRRELAASRQPPPPSDFGILRLAVAATGGACLLSAPVCVACPGVRLSFRSRA